MRRLFSDLQKANDIQRSQFCFVCLFSSLKTGFMPSALCPSARWKLYKDTLGCEEWLQEKSVLMQCRNWSLDELKWACTRSSGHNLHARQSRRICRRICMVCVFPDGLCMMCESGYYVSKNAVGQKVFWEYVFFCSVYQQLYWENGFLFSIPTGILRIWFSGSLYFYNATCGIKLIRR